MTLFSRFLGRYFLVVQKNQVKFLLTKSELNDRESMIKLHFMFDLYLVTGNWKVLSFAFSCSFNIDSFCNSHTDFSLSEQCDASKISTLIRLHIYIITEQHYAAGSRTEILFNPSEVNLPWSHCITIYASKSKDHAKNEHKILKLALNKN